MGNLDPRLDLLDKKLAAHLLRRASFRFTKERVDELTNISATAAVDDLFDAPSPPPYIDSPRDFFEPDAGNGCMPGDMKWIPENGDPCGQESLRRKYVATWWFQNALLDPQAHHKTAFFLHTTFTTGYESLALTGGQNQDVSRYQFDHFRLLNWLCENKALLTDVARKITLDNLMLGYLDNRSNTATNLNENYAREFLELFTIGRGEQEGDGVYSNYTEEDVTEAAKIFTGITHEASRNTSPFYEDILNDYSIEIRRGIRDVGSHDTTTKEFSDKFNDAQSGISRSIPGGESESEMVTEMDAFINLVFAQRATAENYARKIYRFYVGIKAEPNGLEYIDETIITLLADELEINNYNFIETIKILLKSKHFYDRCTDVEGGGNIIKSPVELLTEAMSFFNANLHQLSSSPTPEEAEFHYFRFGSYLINELGENTGLKLFSPLNVAGYPAYHQEPLFDKSWYSPGTLPTRFNIATRLIYFNNNIYTAIDTLTYVIWLHEEKGIDVSIANNVVDEMVNYFFPQGISTERYELIRNEFLGDLSINNWFFEWYLYYGGGPNNEPGDQDENRLRPHTDALVAAVLSAHEFQLK